MANIGIPSLILILVLALLIFGPNKLPELGQAVGKTLRQFKQATNGTFDDEDENKDESSEVQNEKDQQ